MRPRRVGLLPFPSFVLLSLLAIPHGAGAQRADPLETPLPQHLLDLFANQVNGQAAFDNMVKLAGAPWVREVAELTGDVNFHESEALYTLARSYGIEDVRLDRYEAPGTFEYPREAELWVGDRRVARIPGDAALVASGTRTGEVDGRLVYVSEVPEDEVPAFAASMAEQAERYRGAVALMWSHPRGPMFDALDEAGVRAVISFSSRERYFDPDQVVYSRGSYGDGVNLRMGFTVSWRQWSEMLEDLERGVELPVRARAVVDDYPNRFETVYAWIPGTEPDLPGVVFTGHLFEGYAKRGANDNMGGPAVQLEILRALHELIASGELPRPRRTIHFIWPNEISGTYEFLRRDPGLAERLAININMDMVSEGLRNANSWFTMSETPAYLPSFYDGLAASVLNYVWRTNDIVYLPGAPRGRPGGQYFPDPLWEKNGSRDAFRFFIHEATGGSDHLVFNNASVGVPGIEFFTWPDQWYHADADTPDKGDPTEMRRVAFLGATTAWASANLTDEMLPSLLRAVSDFGYDRVAERGIPRAMELLESGTAGDRAGAAARAVNFITAAVERERDALRSIDDIHSGSAEARRMVASELATWEEYGTALRTFILSEAGRGVPGGLSLPGPTMEEEASHRIVPRLGSGIRSVETNLGRYAPAQAYFQEHPDTMATLGLSNAQTQQILSFIDGRRSVTTLRDRVAAWTGEDLTVAQVAGYLEVLEAIGWVVLDRRGPGPAQD